MQHQKQVKRFTAPSMTRALELVREEMGPEAVILSSKRVDDGVEIITSIEPDLPTRGIDVRREFGRHFDAELDTAMSSDSAWKMQAGAEKVAADYGGHAEVNNAAERGRLRGESLAQEIEKARERMLAAKRQAREAENAQSQQAQPQQAPQTQPQQTQAPVQRREPEPRREEEAYRPTQASMSSQYEYEPEPRETAYHNTGPRNPEPTDEEKLHSLQAEIADMRMLLEQQLWRMSENSSLPSSMMPGQVQLPPSYSLLNQHMERLGLPEDIAQNLMQECGQHGRVSDSLRACMASLAKQLPVTDTDLVNNGGVFAFVGPTGVGKTTTIAKLAARYVLEHGPGKVALITTDTYRVGAYDQLRSLGRILNVPVRAVDGEHTLLTLIAGLRNFPLILIDTAGFRHGDPLLQDQLAKLDSCQIIRRVLVMSCNSQLQNLIASTHAYASRQRIDACVLTKLDESASLGEAIGVVLKKQIPVAYVTNGQEIPKDIARARGHGIVASAVNLLKSTRAESLSMVGG